jgi:hypothetical protein
VVNFLFAFLTTGPPAFLLLLILATDLLIPKETVYSFIISFYIINFVYIGGIEENVPEELIFKQLMLWQEKASYLMESIISSSQLTKPNPLIKFTISSHLDFATALYICNDSLDTLS